MGCRKSAPHFDAQLEKRKFAKGTFDRSMRSSYDSSATDTPMSPFLPAKAMVFAAGLGTRMRPLTDRVPKPLVAVAGKPLIDHALDRFATAGVDTAIVNVHYLAGQIEAHLAARKAPRILISDERERLLDQ